MSYQIYFQKTKIIFNVIYYLDFSLNFYFSLLFDQIPDKVKILLMLLEINYYMLVIKVKKKTRKNLKPNP